MSNAPAAEQRDVIGEGLQLMHQPFRVDPAQRVPPDGELCGIVAQQYGLAQEAVGVDAAPLAPSVAICTGS